MSKVCLISLGCPKNLVDSEGLLKRLADAGISYTPRPEESEIILVNTCGFIEDAKRESIGEILRAAAMKEEGGRRKLVVYGCLAKRSGDELLKEIPEIDALWGVGDDEAIVRYCRQHLLHPAKPTAERLTDTPYAYLKIAEGCDRGCSYCVIPGIRGRYRSRQPEEILQDAAALVAGGSRELILVAQDITSFGSDLGGYDLPRLIRQIAAIHGDFWVRLLYLYPTAINDRLLETIASEPKVCNYIDMPLQHSEHSVLRRMGRGGGRQLFGRLVRRIREVIPDVTIRTTCIVGFPGETAEEFRRLLDFVRETQFDRLGVFTYSRETGTKAFAMQGQVPKRTRESRRAQIMKAQAPISLRKNLDLIGRTFRALVDESDGIAVARIYSQAPEIDGVVLIEDERPAKGEFVQVRITAAYDYDLKGEIV